MPDCRLCIFLTHPNQHFSPLVNRLGQFPGLKLKVIYMFDHGLTEYWDPNFSGKIKFNIPMVGKYPFVVLRPNEKKICYKFFNVNSRKLLNEVASFSPDYVWCFGYNSLACWKLVFFKARKYKIIYQGDSSLLKKRSWWRLALKKIVLPLFFRKVDIFFTCGDNNEKYYEFYGVPRTKMVRAPLVVDDEFLLSSSTGPENTRESVREELGFTEDIFLIGFLGKLVSHKRPEDIILLVNELKKRNVLVGAVMVGSGPLISDLKKTVKDLGLEKEIKFLGFVNQDKVGRYLKAVDTLCMPSSTEAYGMAVVEATVFGKPILASDSVGCVGDSDLARPGRNALAFKTGDLSDLVEQAMKIINNKDLLMHMGEESLRLSKNATVGNVAQIVYRTLGKE